MGEQIRLLVVGDSRVTAEGFQTFLAQANELKVDATTGTVEEVIAATRMLQPEVVLISLPLLDCSEADATKRIRSELPDVAVLFLGADVGADVSDEALMPAVAAGACGYVSQLTTAEELSRAIRRADEGEFLLPAATMSRMLASLRGPGKGSRFGDLTDREREVLKLVASGLHNRDIAGQLGIRYGSVRGVVRSILEKLGARSRLQAVALARESRLIDS